MTRITIDDEQKKKLLGADGIVERKVQLSPRDKKRWPGSLAWPVSHKSNHHETLCSSSTTVE